MTAARVRDSIAGYAVDLEVERSSLGGLWLTRAGGNADTVGATLRRVSVAGLDDDALNAITDAAFWAMDVDDRLAKPSDVTIAGEELAVVQPSLDGQTLKQLVRTAAMKKAPLPVAVVCRIALDLLEELEILHDHAAAEPEAPAFGGVTPESTVVGFSGRARLWDIGTSAAAAKIAKWRADPERVAYLAPEQLDDANTTADARTDVYAVGLIMLEALTLARPFPQPNVASLRKKISSGHLPQLSSLLKSHEAERGAVARVIERAIRVDPEERFGSFDEMATALRELDEVAERSDVVGSVVTRSTMRPRQRSFHPARKLDEEESGARIKLRIPRPPRASAKPKAERSDAIEAYDVTDALVDDEATGDAPDAAIDAADEATIDAAEAERALDWSKVVLPDRARKARMGVVWVMGGCAALLLLAGLVAAVGSTDEGEPATAATPAEPKMQIVIGQVQDLLVDAPSAAEPTEESSRTIEGRDDESHTSSEPESVETNAVATPKAPTAKKPIAKRTRSKTKAKPRTKSTKRRTKNKKTLFRPTTL